MKIVLVTWMRLGSKRMPEKMLAKLGNMTLAEIACRRLLRLSERLDVAVRVAVGEPELEKIACSVGIMNIKRKPEGMATDDWGIRFQGWAEQLSEFDMLLYVHGAFPFLTDETIRDGMDYAHRTECTQFIPVFEEKGSVWGESKELINWTPGQYVNTVTNLPFYVPAHFALGARIETLGDRDLFMKEYELWAVKRNHPSEFLEVHDKNDLELCQAWNDHTQEY